MKRFFSCVMIVLLGLVPGPLSRASSSEEIVLSGVAGGGYVPGEILVKFKSETSDVAADGVHAAMGAVKKRNLDRRGGGGLQQVRLPNGMMVEEGVARYRNDPHVEYAEPNYLRHAMVLPNDPDFGQLWGLNNTGQTVNGTTGTVDADIDAPEAWDVTTGSSSVIVAVVDSGVDWNHLDLAANIWTNPGEIAANSTDDDGNGFIDDVHGWDFVDNDNDPTSEDTPGHGTHVSGTIAAVGNNSLGVTGIMWSAQIMPVRFLDASGSGSVSDEILAINYAVANGAKIINASYGDSSFSLSEFDTISAANTAGLLFVAAAGNAGANNDVKPSYPANYALPNIISVAASTQNDQLAFFSNFGATSVDLAAPGTNIRSTVNVPSEDYGFLQGTSMATPHVTGVAGLVASHDPLLTNAQIKTAILNSVDQKSAFSGKVLTGGRLNAFGAVQYPGGADLAVVETASPSPVTVSHDLTYTLTVSNRGLLDAASVVLTDTIPAGTSFVSATPSQGVCNAGSPVTCNLGGLADGAVATVTLVVVTDTTGAKSNTATVTSGTTDSVPANNSAAVSVKVKSASSGGGGGCGSVAPDVPLPPNGQLLFLAALFSPLFVVLARRRWKTIRTRPLFGNVS